jgi:hypothetical protein
VGWGVGAHGWEEGEEEARAAAAARICALPDVLARTMPAGYPVMDCPALPHTDGTPTRSDAIACATCQCGVPNHCACGPPGAQCAANFNSN